MFFCEDTIKTIQDAYTFVCYYAWEDVGDDVEAVFDAYLTQGYSADKFADVLLRSGVITPDLAKAYLAKFSGKEMCIGNMGGTSSQLEFLAHDVSPEDYEKYQALFFAAMLLNDNWFKEDFWGDYEDDIDDDDVYALEGRHEATGSILYGMPQLPLDI